jgi:Na+-transporting methylmalonyl-CoA/oxaloacetate decarboxylase gamma subunit
MFLRLLLIFFIIYLVGKLIRTFTRPVKSNTNSRYYNNSNSKKEGDITVTRSSGKSNKKIPDDEGEYVDYEDV